MSRSRAGRRAWTLAELLVAACVAAVVLCLLMSLLVTSMRAISRRAALTSTTERTLLSRARKEREAARRSMGAKPFDDSRNSDPPSRARPPGRLRELYRNAVLGFSSP